MTDGAKKAFPLTLLYIADVRCSASGREDEVLTVIVTGAGLSGTPRRVRYDLNTKVLTGLDTVPSWAHGFLMRCLRSAHSELLDAFQDKNGGASFVGAVPQRLFCIEKCIAQTVDNVYLCCGGDQAGRGGSWSTDPRVRFYGGQIVTIEPDDNATNVDEVTLQLVSGALEANGTVIAQAIRMQQEEARKSETCYCEPIPHLDTRATTS